MKIDNFFIAQAFGLLALIFSIISVCQSKRSKYIVFNASQNISSGIQYLFLDKTIAFYLSMISLFRLCVYSLKDKYSKLLYIILLIFFASINILISSLTFEVFYDIFPMIASTLVCFTVWQNNINIIKIGVIVSKLLWGIYAIFSLAYFSIIMDIFLILWTIIILIKENKFKRLQSTTK